MFTRRSNVGLFVVVMSVLLTTVLPTFGLSATELAVRAFDSAAPETPDELFATDPVIVFPQDPTVTFFHDTFGYNSWRGRRHDGTDLMAPKMSPVYAIADGVVTIMRKSPRSGYWLAIEHAGMESWYMHLNNDEPGTDNGRASIDQVYAPGLSVGDFVAAGQLIGYVGDSGNAEGTGSHTHFELRIDGRLVDAYDLLVEAAHRDLTVAASVRIAGLLSVVD